MVVLSVILFLAAAIAAIVTIGGTLQASAPRLAEVLRVALGQPEGLPPLPPRRAALRRVRVTRLTVAEEWRAVA
jgi:hypothetical protein